MGTLTSARSTSRMPVAIIASAAAVAAINAIRPKQTPRQDVAFDTTLAAMRTRFIELVDAGQEMFTTDATGLFPAYLATFDNPDERQHHNCNSCRHFFERFGGLVVIDDIGRTRSVLFDLELEHVPAHYAEGIAIMRNIVNRAKVTGVFYPDSSVLGQTSTGPWTHYSVLVPASAIHRSRTKSTHQRAAEKLEDFNMLSRAVSEYSPLTVATAVQLLSSEQLYRSEKVLGIAEWFQNLLNQRQTAVGVRKQNMIWRAVASAPAGFCHVRSSMIGTLLDDLKAGLSYEDVKKKFAAKMNPLQYQRPQAAPSAGNIRQAEILVDQLGIRESLRRRWARLDEIQTIWQPKPKQRCPETTGGVFSHLKPKGEAAPRLNAGVGVITWEKFKRTVLPFISSLELYVTSGVQSFTALTTASVFDAPPILQWDRDEERNPFAWYLYSGGSSPYQFGVNPGWLKVRAITANPAHWYRPEQHANQSESAVFCLDKCGDTRGPGLALFPEILKAELHSVRSTVEAHSRSGVMENAGGEPAAGILFSKNSSNVRLRATMNGVTSEYQIDRWD